MNPGLLRNRQGVTSDPISIDDENAALYVGNAEIGE
jgi:hypothetical protein